MVETQEQSIKVVVELVVVLKLLQGQLLDLLQQSQRQEEPVELGVEEAVEVVEVEEVVFILDTIHQILLNLEMSRLMVEQLETKMEV